MRVKHEIKAKNLERIQPPIRIYLIIDGSEAIRCQFVYLGNDVSGEVDVSMPVVSIQVALKVAILNFIALLKSPIILTSLLYRVIS